MLASSAIALLGVGLAIGCWLRPPPSIKTSPTPPAPSYTSQQTVDARAALCAAFEDVDHALVLAYARTGGSDPAAQLAVATSVQLALDAGSGYLSTTLAEEPATPPDFATAIRKQINAYQKAPIGFLGGLRVSDPTQKPRVSASDEATMTIRGLCK
jgi:hypothetical protein